MDKRILIWNDFELSPRRGGPATYLWHLRKYVEDNGINNIVFLDQYKEETNNVAAHINPGRLNWLKKLIPKKVWTNLRLLKALKGNSINKNELRFSLDQFDIIHFHTTWSLAVNIDLLKDVKAKVLLSSHSPKVLHKEMIEDWYKANLKDVYPVVFRQFEKVDISAFSKADVIVFPCVDAQEPYYNTWKKYAAVTSGKRFEFIETGIPAAEVKVCKEEVMEKYHIPENAKIFCFVGRHNEVKGYDLLKAAAEVILEEYPDAWFLIVGAIGPLQPLNHERWIEVGWTNDPHSVINAATCFVLPNRETYFDLILLEVLSLGKAVILSDTGGNKHFKQFASPEMIFFSRDNKVALVDSMRSFLNQGAIVADGRNYDLFKAYFTRDVFGQNYVSLYDKI